MINSSIYNVLAYFDVIRGYTWLSKYNSRESILDETQFSPRPLGVINLCVFPVSLWPRSLLRISSGSVAAQTRILGRT